MLLETICILNSKAINVESHINRMNTSARSLNFTAPRLPNLIELLPKSLYHKKVRCSIVYDKEILDIKFVEYIPRAIKSLKLVESAIDYSHKFSNRQQLSNLLLQKENCDEVLIAKDGYITDTTFSNVVLENNNGSLVTPSTYLLNGTKRQSLIANGIITEAIITTNDLHKYSKIHLVNAMLDIGETTIHNFQ